MPTVWSNKECIMPTNQSYENLRKIISIQRSRMDYLSDELCDLRCSYLKLLHVVQTLAKRLDIPWLELLPKEHDDEQG